MIPSNGNGNGDSRVPDFDLLVRQLVAKLGLALATVRLGAKSERTVRYWMNRQHLPPITKAEFLAPRVRRSVTYMRKSIAQARAKPAIVSKPPPKRRG